MTTTSPFILSIEPTGKPAYQHGFHLGADETVARKIAAEMFNARNRAGDWTCTVALMRDRRMVDVYDGAWRSTEEDLFFNLLPKGGAYP